jgi:hypothetical protein
MSTAERLPPGEAADAAAALRRVADNVRQAVEVRDEVLTGVLVALAAEGHVLVEDLPGVGKTTLARALARSLGLTFSRVQGTADLLPADLVGTSVYDQNEAEFHFRPGAIFANVVLPHSPRLEVVDVETAAQLQVACEARFDACDVLLMAAAVADFRPVDAAAHKLKKDQVGPELTIALERTPDVLSGLAARRRDGQTLVGFAAETGERAVEYGRAKLQRKRLDAVVVNDVGAPDTGFDFATNEVTIVTASGDRHLPLATKDEIAAGILGAVMDLRGAKDSRSNGVTGIA